MKAIESFEEWDVLVEREAQVVLFVKTENCSVCDGLLPQVEQLELNYPFPFYKVNVSTSPQFAGQLGLFTAPVVLLFNEGKEYARFARFVQIEELKRRLQELTERGKDIA